MTAGRRETEIEFQRATTTQDDYGEEVSTWSTLGTEWADVNWGRGDERRQAAMEQGSQPATFNVLDNPMTRAVSMKNRIILADDLRRIADEGGTPEEMADLVNKAAWDITSSVPGKRRGERDITAVRAA